MKTIARFAFGVTLRSTLYVALTALLSFNKMAYAQDNANLLVAMHKPATTPEKPLFQAAVYPSLQPLHWWVVFQNPAKEWLTFTVKDGKGEPVYQKQLGRVVVYNSRLDFSALADGAYTFEISGKLSRYTRQLLLKTAATRVAKIQ